MDSRIIGRDRFTTAEERAHNRALFDAASARREATLGADYEPIRTVTQVVGEGFEAFAARREAEAEKRCAATMKREAKRESLATQGFTRVRIETTDDAAEAIRALFSKVRADKRCSKNLDPTRPYAAGRIGRCGHALSSWNNGPRCFACTPAKPYENRGNGSRSPKAKALAEFDAIRMHAGYRAKYAATYRATMLALSEASGYWDAPRVVEVENLGRGSYDREVRGLAYGPKAREVK